MVPCGCSSARRGAMGNGDELLWKLELVESGVERAEEAIDKANTDHFRMADMVVVEERDTVTRSSGVSDEPLLTLVYNSAISESQRSASDSLIAQYVVS